MTAKEITEYVFGHCTQDPHELEWCLEQVIELRPKTVLEIGLYAGGTMTAWAQAAHPNALLIGIDDFTQKVHPRVVPQAFQTFEWIRKDSRDPATLDAVNDLLGNAKIDFLFIDGDHSESAVRNDLGMYLPLVRPGGLVGMHDVIGNSDVNRVWEEYRKKYYGNSIFTPNAPHRMGLGTFRIPE